MKKFFLISGLFLSSICFVYSQDDAFRKFRFGLKFDPNVTWLKPNEYVESKGVKMGYNYGLMTDFFLGKNYAIATGLEVLNIGGKVSYPNFVSTVGDDTVNLKVTTTSNIKYQIVNIPFQLKMRTNEIGYMTYFAAFGLDVGIHFKDLANLEHKPVANSSNTVNETKVNFGSRTNFFRPAIAISLGAEYNLSGNTNFVIGLKFSNGFVNTFTKKFDTYKLDNNGVVLLDANNQPVKSDVKANAYSNYLSLLLGIFF